MQHPDNFAQLPETYSSYDTSRVAVVSVPFERTVSYGRGTAEGPRAIVTASQYVETYDEELGSEPYLQGIATLPQYDPPATDIAEALDQVTAEVHRHMAAGKFVVTLGGEHSLSLAPIRAAQAAFGGIGVVQFDAHADLREEYEGSPYSHACIMRRVVDLGLPTAAVGIRSLSTPEAELARERALPILWGHELDRARELFPALIAGLPEKVYLTFDIDFFDPALVPATGTPEPGGGTWYPTLSLLRELFRQKTVVAMDVVELAPIPGQPTSDFVAAKLIYKCLSYLEAKEAGSAL